MDQEEYDEIRDYIIKSLIERKSSVKYSNY